MDALALLCTLHADGPSSLKRLRARGCRHLDALVDHGPEEVADWLEVEPAFARRLLREAKLLRARVGSESLDSEEAPPVRSATPKSSPANATFVGSRGATGPAEDHGFEGDEPLPPTLPREVLESTGVLDETDRELVSRISATPPPSADPESFAEAETEATPATAAGSGPRQDPRPGPETGPDHEGRASAASGTPAAASLTVEASSKPTVVDADWAPGRIAGLDEDLIEDLRGLGITSLAQLAAADSLMLTRSLGVTFAQARRLRFLARREASGADVVGGSEPAPRHVEPTPDVVVHAEMRESPDPDEPSEDPERARFWEPRPFLDAPIAPLEPQGVRVDPAEIEARPRFGEQFARAAAERQQRVEVELPGAPGRTVLGWNFEIPRPETDDLSDVLAPGAGVRPSSAATSDATDDATDDARTEADPAGPFA